MEAYTVNAYSAEGVFIFSSSVLLTVAIWLLVWHVGFRLKEYTRQKQQQRRRVARFDPNHPAVKKVLARKAQRWG